MRAWLVIVAALLGSACTHKDKGQSIATQAPAAEVLTVMEGSKLAQKVKKLGAPLVLVNVWATWCAPCVEEFPMLVQVGRRYQKRGLKLVFISSDFPEAKDQALAFLKKQGAPFPSYLKTGSDQAFIDSFDKDWSGALPASFIFDADGELRYFWQGKVSEKVITAAVEELLGEKS